MKKVWKDQYILGWFLLSIVLGIISIILYKQFSEPGSSFNGIKSLLLSLLIIGVIVLWFSKTAFKIKRGYTGALFMLVILLGILLLPQLTALRFMEAVFPIISILFFLIILYVFLRSKLSYVTEQGIRIGNIYRNSERDLFLKQKSSLFFWKDINKINIVRREVRGKGMSLLRNFLVLKLKKKGDLECFINDKDGFIKSLKKLGKYNLFVESLDDKKRKEEK